MESPISSSPKTQEDEMRRANCRKEMLNIIDAASHYLKYNDLSIDEIIDVIVKELQKCKRV